MLLGGAGAALALEPLALWFLILPAYGVFFHVMLQVETARRAFWLSWCWGFGFFLTGLYWVAISMTVDLARFGWMIPFALAGLNGGLALFTALSGWLFYRLRGQKLLLNWVLFSGLLFAGEMLRSHILTGFPWNLIGYVWGASDASLQIASLFSIYPLTLLTLLLATGGYFIWHRRSTVFIYISILLGVVSFGWQRLLHASPEPPAQPMALIQPNIKQQLKWDPDHRRAAFETHIQLSQSVNLPDGGWYVWSESALPFTIPADEGLPPKVLSWMKPNQRLIAGAVVREGGHFYNSILTFNASGAILSRYDKQHLVPFGEYVPLSKWLPVEKLTAGAGAFSPGSGIRELAIDATTLTPLVCYEIIFPDYARTKSGQAEIILNLTNDDWFGYSSGPFQHLMMARFRAVEQERPVIRVANSGISAFIDRYGRVIAAQPLHTQGVLAIDSNNSDINSWK